MFGAWSFNSVFGVSAELCPSIIQLPHTLYDHGDQGHLYLAHLKMHYSALHSILSNHAILSRSNKQSYRCCNTSMLLTP
jgi:hypothetical protein